MKDFKEKFKLLHIEDSLDFTKSLLNDNNLNYYGTCYYYNEPVLINIGTIDKLNFKCYFWYTDPSSLECDWLNGYQLHMSIKNLKECDISEYKNFLNLMLARQLLL